MHFNILLFGVEHKRNLDTRIRSRCMVDTDFGKMLLEPLKRHRNVEMTLLKRHSNVVCMVLQYGISDTAGKIAEKAMRRSVFLTIWHRILNADSTKTPSSSVTF